MIIEIIYFQHLSLSLLPNWPLGKKLSKLFFVFQLAETTKVNLKSTAKKNLIQEIKNMLKYFQFKTNLLYKIETINLQSITETHNNSMDIVNRRRLCVRNILGFLQWMLSFQKFTKLSNQRLPLLGIIDTQVLVQTMTETLSSSSCFNHDLDLDQIVHFPLCFKQIHCPFETLLQIYILRFYHGNPWLINLLLIWWSIPDYYTSVCFCPYNHFMWVTFQILSLRPM